MEEEIDLRPYIEALLQRWVWIGAAAVLAAVAAFAIASIQPPTYTATALVSVINPQGVELESLTAENVDPRLRTITSADPFASVYPELAVSDKMLQDLLAEMGPQLEDVENLDDLRELLEATPGSGSSLLRFRVQYKDAELAAQLANRWARLFVPWANELFGRQGLQRLETFEMQLAQASDELAQAEDALTAFQAANRVAVLSRALAAATQTQADYLDAQRRLQFLLQDARNLRDQLTARPATVGVTLADQLTALNLQLRAFGAETAVPLELQVASTDTLTGDSRQAQIAFLDSLIATLEAHAGQIETRLAELEPQILALQQQNQEAQTENDRLLRRRSAANEAYTALTRRVVEERISTQDLVNGVRLVSESAVPVQPESRGRLTTTALAFVAGLMVSSLVILGNMWWREANGRNDSGVKQQNDGANV